MRVRILAAGFAAAIALFGLAAIVLLWLAGGGAPVLRRDAADATRDEAAADGALLGPAGSAFPAQGRPAPGIAPAGASREAPGDPGPAPEDADPSWHEIPIASRVRQLGAVAPYVHNGLRGVRSEMGFCFEVAPAARAGPAAAEPDAVDSPPLLLLYLVAREGALDIVDVRIDRLGTWRREVVDCCREVLRGHEIRAPNAVPGRRYRLSHLLQ